MQAIVTKYLGPTNSRGSRIKAKCDAGSITISWDYSLNPDDNHRKACEALRRKLGWGSDYYDKMHMGGLPGQAGNVFVFEDKDAR